jgi:hypothetical protein
LLLHHNLCWQGYNQHGQEEDTPVICQAAVSTTVLVLVVVSSIFYGWQEYNQHSPEEDIIL